MEPGVPSVLSCREESLDVAPAISRGRVRAHPKGQDSQLKKL